MNLYTFLSFSYDLLDAWWFSDKGVNPRDVIREAIPNESCAVLDMCCGTLSNGLSIAKANPKNMILGIDLSQAMLREAKRKIKKNGIRNINLKCGDATNTGLASESFDYIVIGLVLHECAPELRTAILKEAHRLLKKDGKLIILEWEVQKRISRKIKYFGLYVAECLVTKSFKEFYRCDKEKYFAEHNFEMISNHSCNYSAVMEFCKRGRVK